MNPPHSRFASFRQRLEAFDPGTGWRLWLYEFLLFGFKQAWACLFGALLLGLLLATHFFYPSDAPLHRYDFLTLAAIAIQVGMLAFRLETWDEAKVILIFHVVGTVMELFKTAVGSWDYPEASVLHIGAVPLFSGFMYASVGSYIARVWRIFDFRFTHYPSLLGDMGSGRGNLHQFLRASLAARHPHFTVCSDDCHVLANARVLPQLAEPPVDVLVGRVRARRPVHMVR